MRSFLLIILYFSIKTLSYSQSGLCATDSLHAVKMQDDFYSSKYRDKNIAIENYMQHHGNNRSLCENPIVYPVAVHFQETAIGEDCAINMSLNQINSLNVYFSGLNVDIANFDALQPTVWPTINKGESCIQFCLATLNHPLGFGLSDEDYAVTINQTDGDFEGAWAGYINIFVRDIDVAGYSTLGGDGDGDGITIDSDRFGEFSCDGITAVGQGKVAVHEMGHYFNLLHPWANIDDGCASDDFVFDTPVTNGPSLECFEAEYITCTNPILWCTFLEYTYEQCRTMFTEGQVNRMEAHAGIELLDVANNYSIKCLNPLCANFEVSAVVTNTSCEGNDGAIVLNSNGGNLPYSYSLNNGITFQSSQTFTNLTPNLYDLVVTDNEGCTYQELATVATDTPAVNIINIQNTFCGINTGIIELATEAEGDIQYSIDGGLIWQNAPVFENLSPSVYQISTQIDNCILLTSVEIIDLSNFSAEILSIKPVNCPLFDNGSISVRATGGEKPITYILDGSVQSNNGFFGELSEGEHNVLVADNQGCNEIFNFNVEKSFAQIGADCPCTIYAPSAITANEDGLNDLFGVVPNCSVSEFSLRIYDRWGNKVFETFDTAQKWNGATSDYYVQNGIYNYIVTYRLGAALDLNVEIQTAKGIIHVLR
jgi:gliding motility-associated-like protein